MKNKDAIHGYSWGVASFPPVINMSAKILIKLMLIQYAETTLNEIENFQMDLPMVIENESVVPNTSYSKSKVYGNRIHLLGNLADFLAHSRSIWIRCGHREVHG